MKPVRTDVKSTLYIMLSCTLTIRKVLISFDNLLDHPQDSKRQVSCTSDDAPSVIRLFLKMP